MKTNYVDGWRQLELTMAAASLIGAGVAAAGTGGQMILHGKSNKKTREWNERMYGIQRRHALEDWNRTNEYNSAQAQKERLKAAGMNPALMYGQQGAGGVTAQEPRGADVKPWTPQIPNVSGMGLQMAEITEKLALLKAERENIEADTRNKEADTTKTSGVDTEEAHTRIQKLIAETTNETAKKALIDLQSRAQQLENQFSAATIEHRKGLIYEAYAQAEKTTKILEVQKNVAEETKQVQVSQARATLGDTLAGIALKSANIQKIMTDNRLTEELIRRVFKETNWIDIVHERELDYKGAYSSYLRNSTKNQDMTVSQQVYTNLVSHFIGATFDKALQ